MQSKVDQYVFGLVFIISVLFVAGIIKSTKVPWKIQSAFAKKYPAAQNVKWEVEEREYEVHFSKNDKKLACSFERNGTWLETETEIKKKQLPEAIRSATFRAISEFSD